MRQRHDAGAIGFSPYRDSLCNINVSCLFTLTVCSRLRLCDEISGSNLREVDSTPGSVVFLRAPGVLDSDERPYHSISDIREARCSLRMGQLREAA